jgi:hypothetical protein
VDPFHLNLFRLTQSISQTPKHSQRYDATGMASAERNESQSPPLCLITNRFTKFNVRITVGVCLVS